MKTYLMIDDFNKGKAHHIKFADDGKIYYNQAIKATHRGDTEFADFYDDEEVTLDGNHGYQRYINEAAKKYKADTTPLEPGDWVDLWLNQGNRECMILAVEGDQAIGIYQMPKGARYFAIVDAYSGEWLSSQALKSMPKKWLKHMTMEEFAEEQANEW